MSPMENKTTSSRGLPSDARIAQIEDVGIGVARYGLVFLLAAFS